MNEQKAIMLKIEFPIAYIYYKETIFFRNLK